ncbi:RNA polymerase sigma-70 factor (ECF subfamily) [Saonia flava]|uniref:RNA polymerase sigma factor n=1 Tax=Saonia flava TaxID=523696 RepID=A0A846QVR0_9FLAO|nr:RNA polymerase sigma factor [Saonia flava]NJB72391.1 RNA polymerase sigma-70 factor (ECF subfamily) [Saonia flava]
MFQIELVEQCKANNRKAQVKLYRQYCDGMYCVAMRFLKNEDDAEDVLQESFVKAFQKIHQFKGEVTFGAWLKRIVINKSLDFLKSKHEKMVELDETYMQVAEDDDWTIDDGVSVDEVLSEIEGLPEKYKHVVQLFLVEGYDHSEISQILNLTENTCRTRLLRGKGHLRESLKKKNYGTGS